MDILIITFLMIAALSFSVIRLDETGKRRVVLDIVLVLTLSVGSVMCLLNILESIPHSCHGIGL
ncbi:hypothetical protein [Arsenophonus nasoniae]|uniref:Uncharacterized protein n=1 Tax=Arsenophonus nasoniae TaxID=638 RepID=A0AA95G8C8_9GAMM|nr:hypothetical protein [Arsenophonus nasoniae]WGL93852.1 hypothetical protein QE207_00800 [Arsenophonus nasoniae]WGM03310.1 hypothetical protein QE210_18065 [Arsenophonus nasoniae]WGM03374.1 hypothetical protein QE210_17705 [Arsenophonus nasoniae]